MERDRERVVVDPPQLLEGVLRLQPGVHEHQHHPVRTDQVVDRGHRLPRGVARQGQGQAGVEHVEVRRRAALHHDEVRHPRLARDLPDEVTLQGIRLAHRRGQPDRGEIRAQGAQPRQRQRQQISPLRGDERVQLVEDDAAQAPEQLRRLPMGDEERELLGRGEQDVGRPVDLPRALVRGRVAGAGLDADREVHPVDRRIEVARDVDGERLQGGDVQRVERPARALGAGRARVRQLDQGGQEARERLARARRRHQERRAPRLHGREQVELMRARLPAPGREPGVEGFRERGGRHAGPGCAGRVTAAGDRYRSGRSSMPRAWRHRDR